MKLSENTVNILKNFSTINQNILVKEGSSLRTMSTMKNILAEATIKESFPKEFGVYDLNEFLGVLTLVSDADLKFNDDHFLTFKGKNTEVKYMYSDPSILTVPPVTFNDPEMNMEIEIKYEVLKEVLKASAVMQLPDVIVWSENGSVYMKSTDVKNKTSNNFTFDLGLEYSGIDFSYRFKDNNLKMLPGDYKFFGSSGVSKWVGENVTYWIAMESE